ncbi:MAG: DUF481 domain-containing protein [Methylotenera sp.]|nr:DUF481 domain-containing protein [Oligoflexia bacterium]
MKFSFPRTRSVFVLSATLALSLSSAASAATQYVPATGSSQVVNKSDADAKDPFSGGAEINADLTNGNVKIQTIGGAADVTLRTMPLTTKAKIGYLRNKTDDRERARTIYGNLRTGLNLANAVDYFAQGNYFQNKFSGVLNQYEVDTGLGFYPINTETVSFHVEGGLGYLSEDLTFPRKNSFLLIRPGAGLTLKLSDVADLNLDGSFIHSFRNNDDWRIMATGGLTSKITQFLSLKLSHNITKRNVAVPTFVKTDNATLASLVLKF